MALDAVYLDLDGTLLGAGASLLHDGDGAFEPLGVRALEACARAGAEVVLVSGRRRSVLQEDARLLGIRAYAFEAGAGLVLDGELEWLTGELAPRDGRSILEQVADAGVLGRLLEAFAPELRLEDENAGREVTHVFRGRADTAAADALLAEAGHPHLRLLDNGAALHLLPRGVSKARAVARHAQNRGYEPARCLAVGDSPEDLGMAAAVGSYWCVANGAREDPGLAEALGRTPNARVAEAGYGAGVYEAVMTTLAGG